jgi:hypothetical protein
MSRQSAEALRGIELRHADGNVTAADLGLALAHIRALETGSGPTGGEPRADRFAATERAAWESALAACVGVVQRYQRETRDIASLEPWDVCAELLTRLRDCNPWRR